MTNVVYSKSQSVYLGRTIYQLTKIHPEHGWLESTAFEVHMHALVEEGVAFNTLRCYGTQSSGFLDYLEVGFEVIGVRSSASCALLARLYDNYLTKGLMSRSDIVRAISQRRRSPLVNQRTSNNYHVPIEKMILACHDEVNTKAYSESDSSEISDVELLASLRLVKIPKSERELDFLRQIYGRNCTVKSSMRLRVFSHLPKIGAESDTYGDDKYFPLNKISELIGAATSYRDASLWAVIAATSLRANEALQLLWCDICQLKREVYAVDPKLRKDSESAYAGLDAVQREKLSWKGRKTRFTLLLEPYGMLFFYYLEMYQRYEYNSAVQHQFVFQAKDGYPLRFCDYGSVIVDPFIRAAKLVLGADLPIYRLKLHSLRHSYCVYLKNYVEHTHGIGLSDHEIMVVTGHSDVKSIAKYGVLDIQLLRERLAVGFLDRQAGSVKSQGEFLIMFHEKRIQNLKERLVNEEYKGHAV